MKAIFARAFDVVCFVIGPVIIAANLLNYGRFGYSDDARFFAGIGFGLVALGFLRIYWSKTNIRK